MKINYSVFEIEHDGEREFIAAQTKQEALQEHFSRGTDMYEHNEQPTVTEIDVETQSCFEGDEITWKEFLFDFERCVLLLKEEWMNKIYHGDCMKIMPKLPNNSMDLILTDIPYGAVTQNGEDRAKYSGQMRKLDKGLADIKTFDLNEFLEQVYRLSKGSIYIFCGIEQMSSVFSFFNDKKNMSTRQCMWHKTNPSPVNGQHYWIHSIENCVFAKKRKTTFNQHCKHNVWDFPVGRSKIHPTEKPLKLFEYLVESSSNEGDMVFDPCSGSGTTAVAALNKARKYICIESDEKFHTDSVARLNSIIE